MGEGGGGRLKRGEGSKSRVGKEELKREGKEWEGKGGRVEWAKRSRREEEGRRGEKREEEESGGKGEEERGRREVRGGKGKCTQQSVPIGAVLSKCIGCFHSDCLTPE